MFSGTAGTVDHHERLAIAVAERVNSPRRQVFAGARFTCNEHGQIGFGNHLDGFVNPLHGAASPHQVLKCRFILNMALQPEVFPQQAAAFQSLPQR